MGGVFANYYIAENVIDYPEECAVIKLSEPQVFVRFYEGQADFDKFRSWKKGIVVIEWLSGTAPAKNEQEIILENCWKFYVRSSREITRLLNSYDDL